MSTQYKALQLAELLDDAVQRYPQTSKVEPGGYCTEVDQVMADSADKLRRLHSLNAELLDALKLGVQETLDYIQRNHLTGAENNDWIVQARAVIAKAEEA